MLRAHTSLPAIAGILLASWLSSSSAVSEPKRFVFGAYDPYGTFSDDAAISIEHIYIPWENADLSSIKTAATYAIERKRSILLSVEPWSWGRNTATPAELHKAILSGTYDPNMAAICQMAGSLGTPVTVRWAHEMDLRNGRFPWSEWTPEQYVSAYRHVVDVCRREAGNLRFMWSPRGEKGFEAFFPGDAYVDDIGLTIFAYQDYEKGVFGRNLSMHDRLDGAYVTLAAYQQDLYITEFGCHGDKEYKKRCQDEVNSAPKLFPKLAGLIYFNEIDTFPWPAPYGHPDWRVFNVMVSRAGTVTR